MKICQAVAGLLASILISTMALAQPGGGGSGPGPVPDPWIVSGATLSYNNGGLTLPQSVTGGTKGAGTINVANGYYENGVRLHGVNSATAPVVLSSNVVSLNIDANFSVVASNLALAAGGVAYPSSVTGGAKGAGTINATGLYVNGVAVTGAGITSLTGDVVATGPGSAAATIQPGVVTYAKFQTVAASSLVGNPTGSPATSQAISLGATFSFSGTALQTTAHSGDATSPANSNALTLATVNTNVGAWGSATQAPQFTVNGKGLVTAAANVTITPAIASVTGLGTGVATALAVNVGSAGAFVTFNGALGTPSSGVATNLTGTAAGLTAGNVTTNANLTGPITSVGNATSIASQTGTGTKFVVDTAPTIAGLTVTGSFTATGLVTNADLTNSSVTINGSSISLGASATITAAAGTLTGTTLNATVVTSSLTAVGALAGGSATTGFTISAANVTWSGQVPGASVAVVGNASGSPSATFGVLKADGTTIQCTSGTCSAVGGVATAVTVGTTTVNSGTSGFILNNNAGVLGNLAATSIVFGTGTLNLSGNLTTTGAFNPTFAIPASVTYTFPGSAATLAALNVASQTLSGGANVTPLSIATGSFTVNCGARPLQYITGSTSAWTITAPANDGSCMITLTNAASSAVIPSFSGFTVSSAAGALLTNANSAVFYISVWRINGVSGYSVQAGQ